MLGSLLPPKLPRLSLHAATYAGRSRLPPKFGSFQRIYPASLSPSKPLPLEPSSALVPPHINRPYYASSGSPSQWSPEIPIVPLGSPQYFKLRAASRLASDALKYAGSLVKQGITTLEIDSLVHQFIISKNAYPSPLNYMGFPKSICTSINNIIAHGIPDSRKLIEGDIINIDITVFLDGYHGDTSSTFCVGCVDQQGLDLVKTTEISLTDSIKVCGPGVPFKSIGKTVQHIAKSNNYSTVSEFSGHGIGTQFHQQPLIFHFQNDEPGTMQEGMVFTVEPMLCQGSPKLVIYPDGWTASTIDGGRSAQFEHTIIITNNGAEILTQ
ncbi:hypothetical protein BB559_001245 [Furculomyces boomerangus]|uniref:Methionine aminopeptidase n=2 Tax=Harpellales TaxID=61421 RepID=A0A2T9Z2I7_9FUNG|nr:hypothetical protein BB559_002642 [Furculomyces boomerangus]PVU98791.1 hypothetical protein BB559_001245 [Furculomyces boomerangus]PWA01894.1 hypothetical protein BB558_002001 [Smittium angustum]